MVWLVQGHRKGVSSTDVISNLALHSHKMMVKTAECLTSDDTPLL